MITNDELSTIELSATKKDFYQIWNELIEVASKITERWDPKATNESDPGIVLLKALTGIADKLNYTIDKNILEAFMPSAAQSESMRKLCTMMGYNMKYYQSAETEVIISYNGSQDFGTSGSIMIPIFTTVSDEDDEITYTITEAKTIQSVQKYNTFNAIEGQVVQCSNDTDNIITLAQLDDNHRYTLPEYQIAENGIFIWNINDGNRQDRWEKVNNLNSQPAESKVFVFGFDSRQRLPYIQFPADVDQLAEDGFEIYYTRTNGINGNVAASTFSKVNKFDGFDDLVDKEETPYDIDDFSARNVSAATNGANPESIDDAYENFKKTIGTFDTLVTCRDYMNKIYQLMDDNNNPLVSNIIVSDIRDDINNAITLCSFDDYGICYKDMAITNEQGETAINHFDLILYPFKTVYGLNTKNEYKSSFTIDDGYASSYIQADLEQYKTISHSFKTPIDYTSNTIVCIKNYLKLDARITTTYKVTSSEQTLILDNIKSAIYKNFNMRKIDFGEEIPFDTILKVIENADPRIKNVALDDPELSTVYLLGDGSEYAFTDTTDKEELNEYELSANRAYNRLTLRNILAGRVELFNYNLEFAANYNEKSYTASRETAESEPSTIYSKMYPEDNRTILKMTSKCQISTDNVSTQKPIKLLQNETVQFRAPNFITEVTYPAYVNYYFHRADTSGSESNNVAAHFITLLEFMTTDRDEMWNNLYTYCKNNCSSAMIRPITITTESVFTAYIENYGMLFYLDEAGNIQLTNTYIKEVQNYRYIPFTDYTYVYWRRWLLSLNDGFDDKETHYYKGFYRNLGSNDNRVPGELIDENTFKYKLCESGQNREVGCLTYYYVANKEFMGNIDTNTGKSPGALGHGGEIVGTIKADTEYAFATGDYLLINYTKSADSTDENSKETVINLVLENSADETIIIRPNFDLADSNLVHLFNGTSWVKKDGYYFDRLGSNQPEGMFSLGADEQIEKIGFAQVKLDEMSWLYWDLPSQVDDTEFPFELVDNDGIYTLQDNEYIFYTDENKLDFAYYGSGTKVVYHEYSTNNKLVKTNISSVSTETILEQGISAIPWNKVNFSETNYLELKEYQYITLNEKDKIILIGDIKDDNLLDNTWKNIKTRPGMDNKIATYIIDDEQYDIMSMNVGTGNGWEVRSRLNFNLGPEKTQELQSERDEITIYFDQYTSSNTLTIKPKYDTDKQLVPLSVKGNYVIDKTADSVDTVWTFDNDGESITIDDFKLRIFETVTFGIDPNNTTSGATTKMTSLESQLATGTNGTTKLSMADLKTTDSVNLYVELLDTYDKHPNFGLLMIYVLNTETPTVSDPHNPYLKYLADTATKTNTDLVIYNLNSDTGWWNSDSSAFEDGKKDGTGDEAKYYLRTGVNVIKIPNSGTIKLYPDNMGRQISEVTYGSATVLLSSLDIIINNECNGINQDVIKYQRLEVGKAGDAQLLEDINAIDTEHNFYYNVPVENSVALNLQADTDDTTKNTMMSPRLLYDTNNVNNKFVISEINADELSKGIMIVRSSRK